MLILDRFSGEEFSIACSDLYTDLVGNHARQAFQPVLHPAGSVRVET